MCNRRRFHLYHIEMSPAQAKHKKKHPRRMKMYRKFYKKKKKISKKNGLWKAVQKSTMREISIKKKTDKRK